MTAVFKLVFDLSVYYSLTGFYLNIFQGSAALIWPLAALSLMICLHRLGQRFAVAPWLCRLAFLCPLATLFFAPGIWDLILMLPAWAYGVWALETGHFRVDYDTFRKQFFFGLKMLLLITPTIPFVADFMGLLQNSMPFILVMLAVGVCALRTLHAQGQALVNALVALGFLALCALLTHLGFPAWLGKALYWLYEHLFLLVIRSVGYVAVMFFYTLFSFLASLYRPPEEQGEELENSPADRVTEMFGVNTADGIQDTEGGMIFGYITIGVLAIALMILLLRKLFAADVVITTPQVVRSQEYVQARRNAARRRLVRPTDPREAVRYYYGLFLRECRRRGAQPPSGSTAQEIAVCCREYFPGAEPEDILAIYDPARYWTNGPVTENDVKRASQAWSRLRRTRYKGLKEK